MSYFTLVFVGIIFKTPELTDTKKEKIENDVNFYVDKNRNIDNRLLIIGLIRISRKSHER